jgi:hypothetical protein
MNFNVWKKIKKQLSPIREKEIAIFRSKKNDRSLKEKHLESNVQAHADMQEHSLSKQMVPEDASKHNGTEPIEDMSIPEENQLTSSSTTTSNDDYNQDYVLKVLHDLPEQWIGKEVKLHVIADKKDAARITKRVFEDVERGLITAQFTVKESNHLCDITLILKVADGLARFPSAVTAINPVFSFILTDIKSEAISRRKRKIKSTKYLDDVF